MSHSLDSCTSALRQRFGANVLCDVVSVHGDPARLHRAEAALVAAAVPSRRREFAAGRCCARELLSHLGFEAGPLLSASDRSPLWPSGAVGSIAHDGQLCAVAVARADRVAGIGLDVEPNEPLAADLWHEILTPSELDRLAAAPQHSRGSTARVLFSAKECVYKCLHGRVRPGLGFQDVDILMAPGSQRFRAVLHDPQDAAAANVVLEGFHVACAGSILTGMTLTATAAPSRRTEVPLLQEA